MTTDRESINFEQLEWRPEAKVFERDGGYVCQWVPFLKASTIGHKLDEEFGIFGWRDIYEQHEEKDHMWCHIEARDPETGEWIRRTDVGKASTWDPTKGVVSDAFKRCATLRWGIGRQVYNLPKLYAPCRSDGQRIFGKTTETDDVIAKSLAAAGHDVKVSVDPEPIIDYAALGWASELDCVEARKGLIEQSGSLLPKSKSKLFAVLEELRIYNPTTKEITEGLSQAQANAWADALEAGA